MIIPSTTLGVSGKFRLVLSRDKAGKDIKYETEFDNLVTNAGLDRLMSTTSKYFHEVYGQFAVGADGATPAPSNEKLGSQVAVLTTDPSLSYSSSYANRLYEVTAYGQFVPGAVDATHNLQEIGLRSTLTGNKLFCRAQMLDSGGLPTSIPFGPNDYLGCYYTLQFKMPDNDIVYSNVPIDYGDGNDPTLTTITIRPLHADYWSHSNYYQSYHYPYDSGTLFAFSGGLIDGDAATSVWPDGPIGNTYHASTTTKLTGPDRRRVRYNVPFEVLNSSNISTFTCQQLLGSWQINYNPPLKKTSSQTMTIDLFQSFTRGQ